MTKRRKLPKDEERIAEWFFATPADASRRCIVTAAEGAWWHHLDDDESNSVFENVVPLSPDLNSCLRDVRKRRSKRQPIELEGQLSPDALMGQAMQYASTWKHGPAYGCARLACFVSRNYLQYSFERFSRFAGFASYCARQKLNYRLVADVVNREFVIPIEKADSISALAAAIVLQEVAGIFGEQGFVTEAREIYGVLDALRPSFLFEVHPFQFALALRRRATVIGADGGRRDVYTAMLRDARAASDGDENILISTTLSEAWLLLHAGDAKAAVDLLEEHYERYRRRVLSSGDVPNAVGTTGWNAAELMLAYALALTQAGVGRRSEKRDRALAAATTLFEKTGARPYTLIYGAPPTVGGSVPNQPVPPPRPPLPAALADTLRSLITLTQKKVGLL